MRRVLPLRKFSRDQGAMAPYAVVAVVLLLGAGLSYAYLAHLQTTRQALDSTSPWTDDAIRALHDEEALLGWAVDGILRDAASDEAGMDATGLVASVALRGQATFSGWVDANYPKERGALRVEVVQPRFSVCALYGTVVTGNVLGQQVPQTLPVGLEAVGSARVNVLVGDGSRAGRQVVVRSDVLAPQVLAAHLQDVLEYSLADEGLCTALVADALAAKVAHAPDWEPEGPDLQALVRASIGAVQRSLFHSDGEVPWLPDGPSSADLLGLGSTGRVRLEATDGENISVTNPRSGETSRVRLVPRVEWLSGPEAGLRVSRLWSAEAGGGDAVIARFDMAGLFRHRVDVWSDGVLAGTVDRRIGFRDHLTTWAMDMTDDDDGNHYGRAQVEDWLSFEGAMAVVSPPPGTLRLDLPSSFGREVEVSLDGVPLGIYGPGVTNLPNVLAGPHEVTLVSASQADRPATCSTRVLVTPGGGADVLRPVPGSQTLSRAQYAFWYSIMAAFHMTDAGPLAHLEHIASMAGYPLLPSHVVESPEEHLEEISFWTEGLEHHLEYLGGKWDLKGVTDPVGTLDQAKQVVKLSQLTYKLLVKLPRAGRDVARATIIMGTSEGRTEFSAWVDTGKGPKEILRGTSDGEGCTVWSSLFDGKTLERVDTVLTAISVITSALTVCCDVVEFAHALSDGDAGDIVWSYVDLQLDMAKLVIGVVSLLGKLGYLAVGSVAKSVISVVGAAIAVVATFLDAYRDAGEDFWGAWDLLLHPDGFSAALRSAGFFSAVASLVTTVVLTLLAPSLTGAAIGWAAFMFAASVATGVGLVVFGAVLLVWAIVNWDSIRSWVSGTADDDDVDGVRKDVESVLLSTLDLRARLNGMDVLAEVSEARVERGVGLALQHVRSLSGNGALVEAMGGAGLHHLDAGSSHGRRARAVQEARFWIEALWREVDDFVDNDRCLSNGEDSEGFRDHKGSWGSKDHTFDADIEVSFDGVQWVTLDQASGGIDGFLRGVTPDSASSLELNLDITGAVYGKGLEDWIKALGAVSEQLGEATDALARSSKETTYLAAPAAETLYSRDRGLVQVLLPEGVSRAEVEVSPQLGALLIDGKPAEGRRTIQVTNGSAMLVASGWMVHTRVASWEGDADPDDVVEHAQCPVVGWWEIGFGGPVLEHFREG